jgi:hypothetical protein
MKQPLIALLVLLSSLAALAQGNLPQLEPASVAAIVHSPKPLLGIERLGTAWCLDKDCSLMITNYHVAKFIGKKLTVNGVHVESVSLATGPDDVGARDVDSFTQVFKYVKVRDLALLRMRSPMKSKGMHGVPVFAGQLQVGQPVRIISYPGGKLTVTAGRFDFADAVGMLQFQLSTPLAPGSSGGLILNEEGEAVGVVMGIPTNFKPLAYAVPVWSLAEFVEKSRPDAYTSLFPANVFRPSLDSEVTQVRQTRENSSDVGEANEALPTNQPRINEDGVTPVPVLPRQSLNLAPVSALAAASGRTADLRVREEEAAEIQTLRQKAQSIVEGMTNLIALQTVTQANKSVQQQFVRVVDGKQVFVFPDGMQVDSMPLPKGLYALPGSEWRDLPETVSTNRHLPLRYLGERNDYGLPLKVFYFEAAAEDKVCWMRVVKKFWKDWIGASPCHGEVWTDADLNILRISEQLNLPAQAGIKSCSIAILYGWLHHDNLPARLVPTAMHMASTYPDATLAESFTRFSSYHQFHTSTKIAATSAEAIVK